MKKILSKVALLGLPILLTAVIVMTSITLADGGLPLASDETVVPAASEPESPRDYDLRSVTEDHPVSLNGGESDKPREYDYEPILDDEPVNPAGDGVE